MEALVMPSNGNLSGPGRETRIGYEFHVPGACLDPGSTFWSEGQQRLGIYIKAVYLTPKEEEAALSDAKRADALVASSAYTLRKALVAVAPAGEPDSEGVPTCGEWKKIVESDLPAFFKELGYKGRQIAMMAFNKANAVGDEERSISERSFRLST